MQSDDVFDGGNSHKHLPCGSSPWPSEHKDGGTKKDDHDFHCQLEVLLHLHLIVSGPGGPGPTGPSASPFGGGTTPSPFAAQATSAGPVASSPFAQPAGPFAPVATGDGRSVSPFAATGQVSWSESKGSLFYSRDWTKNVHSLYQDCIGYIVIRNIVACTTVILLL